jgi:hypothetical protein
LKVTACPASSFWCRISAFLSSCSASLASPDCSLDMARKLHSSPTDLHASHTSSESLPKKCCRITSPRSMQVSASRYLPACCSFTAFSSSSLSVSSSAFCSSCASASSAILAGALVLPARVRGRAQEHDDTIAWLTMSSVHGSRSSGREIVRIILSPSTTAEREHSIPNAARERKQRATAGGRPEHAAIHSTLDMLAALAIVARNGATSLYLVLQ